MAIDIRDINYDDLYAKNGLICYGDINTFKTKIDKMYYSKSIFTSYNYCQNNIILIIMDKRNLLDATHHCDEYFEFIKYKSNKFDNENYIDLPYTFMYVDPLKFKMYHNYIELDIPTVNVLDFILQNINNKTIEYTFELSNNRYVTTHYANTYSVYISKIKIIDYQLFEIYDDLPIDESYNPQDTMSKNQLEQMEIYLNDKYSCSLCYDSFYGKRYNWKCCNQNICIECGLQSIGKQETKCPFCRNHL